ncbi:TetR/AcrR family transcriptional regulator [Tsukamurella sp. 1534]|uniref:TetR/AcrR family transcriptional regulator n=1 Tax=Tsukamurella sp. 1534 TaxID=1151061 RepID=UPI001ED9BF38|nr:TetR/AcrR family transcriptional regulator [Tsukamurella sp. 1534]
MAPRRDTRRRMLLSAVDLMRERGAAGVTIDAVLERSAAPRGSVYHHFPGGRAELVADALDLAGDSITALIEGASGEGAVEALRRFSAFWAGVLLESDFAAGCPVVSVAVGGSFEEEHLRPAVADTMGRWRDVFAAAMVTDGLDPRAAASLATVAIASIEGAIILCRVQRSVDPLNDVIAHLVTLVSSAGPA